LARALQPDVILMDINLPGISGLDGHEDPGADPATAHIPVVALSANAMPRDIEKGLQAGFFSYLTKPIKVAEFMARWTWRWNSPQPIQRVTPVPESQERGP
jgi:CheY-like chemotaxis protein